MAVTRLRRGLNRLHIWLGWIVGIQILLWTVSGLFMVLRPIEEVRGEHLRPAPAPLAAERLVAPGLLPEARPVKALALEMRGARPIWVIRFADGGARIADARTGRFLRAPDAPTIAGWARNAFTGGAALQGIRRVDPADPPLDYRRAEPAWRASFADGTRLYLDAETGAVLSVRTRWWRAYDLMWGLHIMDWRGREDMHHPLLIAAAMLSLASILLGLILLPFTIRRRGRHAVR